MVTGSFAMMCVFYLFSLAATALSSTQFDFATFSLSLEIHTFYDTRWSTGQFICTELVQSILKNVSICFLCYCHNTHHTFYFTCMTGTLIRVRTTTNSYAFHEIHTHMLLWCNAIFTNSKYWSLFWHSTRTKYGKGKWSILLFLLSCAMVTMEINCANSTQPSN